MSDTPKRPAEVPEVASDDVIPQPALAGEHIADALRRLRSGDSAAVGELFDTYADRLFRYLLYLVRTREDAEDLLHDTFLAAVKGLGNLRNENALGSYLFSTARQMAYRHLARDRKFVLLTHDADEPAIPGPEDWTIDRERLEDLRLALDHLTPEQREAIVLAYLEELPYREIGEITERSENAVKALVFRAMKRLRQVMNEERDPL